LNQHIPDGLAKSYLHAGPLPSDLDKSASPQWSYINPQNNAHTKMEKSKSAIATKRRHITEQAVYNMGANGVVRWNLLSVSTPLSSHWTLPLSLCEYMTDN
jgi:hypothetical protein